MSTTTSISTTYAGQDSKEYIAAALLSGRTLNEGLITIKPNVKHKSVLHKVETGSILKSASCDFDSSSSVTLSERIIEPLEFNVNLQLCKSDFRSDWMAEEMGFSAHDQLAPSFADFLIGHVSAKVAQKIEQNIWVGDSSNDGEFSGITTLIGADANLPAAQEVSGTTLTAANIITEMGKVADAINNNLYGEEDLYIYASQNAVRLYVRALGGFASNLGANGVDNRGTLWYGGGDLTFDGIKVVMANGLGDNQMIAAQKSNLYFGTGLLNDLNLVKVIDMSDLDGSDNVRVIMKATAGVQYAIAEDITTYGVTNSAN